MRTLLLSLALVAGSAIALLAQTGRNVTLTWPASPSLGVTGYNVYRASAACTATPAPQFTKLNATPIPGLTYTDVVPIGTYCYYATAFGAGLESGPSLKDGAVAAPLPPPGFNAEAAFVATVKFDGREIKVEGNAQMHIEEVAGQ